MKMTPLESRVSTNFTYLVNQARAQGYKDYEIAALMGVSPAQMSRWCAGKSAMSLKSCATVLDWFARFASKHGVAPVSHAEFFGGLLIQAGEE